MKKSYEWEVNDNVFIRTLTDHWIGRIVDIKPDSIVLEDFCWVSDSGLFGKFLVYADKNENVDIEVAPKGLLNEIYKSNICCVIEWQHDLPDKTI